MQKKYFQGLFKNWKSYFQKNLSPGAFFRIALILGLLIAPLILPYLQLLSFLDFFSVITGAIALILTGYQMYLATVREDANGLREEVDDTRDLLIQKIDEGNELCKERFEYQNQMSNYLLERVNNLTIDIKSHERLPGHNGISLQLSSLRDEVAEMRAIMSALSQKAEIINRINQLEKMLNLGIDNSTNLEEPNT